MGFLALAAPLVASVGTMFGGAAAAAGTAGGIGALAQGAGIASTVLGVGGALYEGASQSALANYRAKVAQNNSAILRADAENQLVAGSSEESQHRTKVGQLIGTQKATQAASGVDVGVGSAKMVRDATQNEGDLDALTIRYNTAKAAYDTRQKAEGQLQEAAMQKAAAKNAKYSSYISAASSLATGVGKYADMKGKFKTSGVK